MDFERFHCVELRRNTLKPTPPMTPINISPHKTMFERRTVTTHIKRQLISGDNSYQFEKATTHIKR